MREFRLIQQVEINKPYVFAIRTSRSKMFESKPLAHTFSVYDGGGFIDFFMRGKEPYMKHGYILNPYFGGDEPAQHDTIIKMSKAIIS